MVTSDEEKHQKMSEVLIRAALTRAWNEGFVREDFTIMEKGPTFNILLGLLGHYAEQALTQGK